MKLKCIIIENSEVTRTSLVKLITKHANLDLVAEYSDALEAGPEAHINIDLIFLAIDLPVINGFEYIRSLHGYPTIVLIGGKTDYGIKAFEYGVTDYLTQPITNDRLVVAVKKAINNNGQIAIKKEKPEHIFVRNKLSVRKVILSEIECIEALGDYIKLIMVNERVIVLSTMTDFISQLPPEKFVRIHKSFIVNLEKVERFNCNNVLVNGREIPLSRKRRKEFRTAFGVPEHA